MDEGEGNEPMDQFHRSEAISAVADDGFMGEDDEDYDDLYNDVNVGEGFLQSMRGKSEAVSGPAAVDYEDEDNQVDDPSPPPPPPPAPAASQLPKDAHSSIPGVGGGSGEGSAGRDVGARYGQSQNVGFRGNEVGAKPAMRVELGAVPVTAGVEDQPILHQPPPPLPLPPPPMAVPASHGGAGGAGTVLYVGDLHWWTTDAELEAELCKYGQVKEVKFFDEKASGKSKGYCQVEFFDPAATTACKENMNGHLFNGRPCVVAYATPFNIKRMGEAQFNRTAQNQVSSTGGLTAQNQLPPGSTRPGSVQQPLRRGPPDNSNNLVSKPSPVGNYSIGNGENNNNRGGFGRGGWARGNGNRVGPMGQIRGRGMAGRGVIGNGFGPAGPNPMLHPQAAMMGHHHPHQGGFDPGFGRAAYGGFPGGPVAPPFSGMLPAFPPGVGLPGVAPHVNPAFFGRGGGMGMNGMGIMPGSAGVVDGPPGMMWADPGMGPWGSGNGNGNGNGDDQEAASDHQYTDDRGTWTNNNNNNMKDKDRGGSERDWSGSSDRRYRDENRDPPTREKEAAAGGDKLTARERRDRDRDHDRDRDRDRERERARSRDRDRERDRDHHQRDHRDHRDRERHRDERDYHRYKERESEHHEEEWDRGRGSSRANQGSKSRAHNPDDDHQHRSRSREADYGKRRRLTSE